MGDGKVVAVPLCPCFRAPKLPCDICQLIPALRKNWDKLKLPFLQYEMESSVELVCAEQKHQEHSHHAASLSRRGSAEN